VEDAVGYETTDIPGKKKPILNKEDGFKNE
jgi:hypothetical protein